MPEMIRAEEIVRTSHNLSAVAVGTSQSLRISLRTHVEKVEDKINEDNFRFLIEVHTKFCQIYIQNLKILSNFVLGTPGLQSPFMGSLWKFIKRDSRKETPGSEVDRKN